MTLLKRQVVAVIGLVLLLATAGCWDREEIENLAFVTALGIDRTEEGGYEVTVHIAKPFAISKPSEGSVSLEKPFFVMSSTGRTVVEAMAKLLSTVPRRLFLAHNRVLLLGEPCSRDGVAGIVDYFLRDPQARCLVRVQVVKGTTAKDFLNQIDFELERMPSEAERRLFRYSWQELGCQPSDVTLKSFCEAMEEDGIEPVAAAVELLPKSSSTFSGEGAVLREGVKASAKHTGTAVFKGDRMVGWLDERETRGFNWILGQAVRTRMVVQDAAVNGSVQILHTSSSIRMRMEAGTPVVSVKVRLEGRLNEMSGGDESSDKQYSLDRVEHLVAATVSEEMLAALARAKELKSDIFGFGLMLSRKHPREWSLVKDRWEAVFRDLRLETDVKATIESTGLIRPYVREGGH